MEQTFGNFFFILLNAQHFEHCSYMRRVSNLEQTLLLCRGDQKRMSGLFPYRDIGLLSCCSAKEATSESVL